MLYFGRILQRQELDAFLAMSVSPLLVDVQTMQDLKVFSSVMLNLKVALQILEQTFYKNTKKSSLCSQSLFNFHS